MSREIKFRVWDAFNERMIYEPSSFVKTQEHHKIDNDERFNTPFQYYETWQDEEDGVNRPKAEDDIPHLSINRKNGWWLPLKDCEEMEIIGDVYQNPKLINQKS